jgi:hypothetical protein
MSKRFRSESKPPNGNLEKGLNVQAVLVLVTTFLSPADARCLSLTSLYGNQVFQVYCNNLKELHLHRLKIPYLILDHKTRLFPKLEAVLYKKSLKLVINSAQMDKLWQPIYRFISRHKATLKKYEWMDDFSCPKLKLASRIAVQWISSLFLQCPRLQELHTHTLILQALPEELKDSNITSLVAGYVRSATSAYFPKLQNCFLRSADQHFLTALVEKGQELENLQLTDIKHQQVPLLFQRLRDKEPERAWPKMKSLVIAAHRYQDVKTLLQLPVLESLSVTWGRSVQKEKDEEDEKIQFHPSTTLSKLSFLFNIDTVWSKEPDGMLLQKLVRSCPNLRKLFINGFYDSIAHIWLPVVEKICNPTSLPHLKELGLRFSTVGRNMGSPEFRDTILQILEACPQVLTVQLYYYPWTEMHNPLHQPFFENFADWEHDEKEGVLTYHKGVAPL